MDHNEAIQMQAAEKYILGELPAALRDEYEEHFFDCAECALDVKAVAVLADNSREVLKQEARKETSQDPAPHGGGWLAWFRPVVAVPAFAVLLLALGYQSFISVPHWKNAAVQATAPRVLLPYSLIAANTRGTEAQTFRVRPDELFDLYVDVPNDPAYSTYVLRLEDPAGNSTTLRTVSYAQAQKTVVVEVPLGKGPGVYQIVVLGLPAPQSDPNKAPVLARMKFIVEFSK
jgi:hypothetical protein